MAVSDAFKNDDEIDAFLGAAAHQLRTPLNVITGWSDLLRRDGTRDEALLTEGLETIHRNAVLQAKMISDLMDIFQLVSHKLSLQMQAVSLVEPVKAAIASARSAADAKHLALEFYGEAQPKPLRGDAARLRQVAEVLLANAIKFSPKGGGAIRAEIQSDSSRVMLRISDSGQGIDAETLPAIFDRFTRREKTSVARRGDGLRLGLAIARELVALHGGTLAAESDGPQRGSRFTVTLPAFISCAPV